MPKTFKLVSFIVADDCRREDNGKEIIIGTYTGAMIIPMLPAVLPSLVLRFEIIPNQIEYKKAVAFIRGPQGNEVFRVEGGLLVSRPQFGASFFYKASPVLISVAGEHKIYLGLDEEPEEIGTLMVLHEPLQIMQPQPVT